MYENIPREIVDTGETLFFFLFAFLGLLIGLIRVQDRNYMRGLIRGLADFNYLEHLDREGKLGVRSSNIFLDMIFIVSASLFLFLLLEEQQIVYFWYILPLVFAGYILHAFFLILTAGIFYGPEGVKAILQSYLLFNRVLGIFLTPVLFLLYFLDTDRHFLLVMLGILIILYLVIAIFRTLFQLKSTLPYGYIYNFFYFCAVEISPLLVIFNEFYS